MTPPQTQIDNARSVAYRTVWETADKYLRSVVEPEEYGDYIIPFVVLRRVECLISDKKDQMLALADKLTGGSQRELNPHMMQVAVRKELELPFYNTSKLDLTLIGKTDDSVAESLHAYLLGFSPNLESIWEAFDFPGRISTLDRANRLFGVVNHFASIDMHPDTLPDTIMGDLFEDIMYRAFNTKGKGAGAFYTPRDAIALMVQILFASDDYGLAGDAPVRSIYDPAAGTGGMLLVAKRELESINQNAQISLYGQELMDYAYAMGTADLIIQGGTPDAIRQGDTLADDLYDDRHFDYILTNPPFGTDWSASEKAVKSEAEIEGSRFSHGLPPKSDGQMLFLSHVVHKLSPAGPDGTGGRGGVVMNGSPLFTGPPGSGSDQIREWLLRDDLVDAIIALPTNMFYGTGIATYIWIVDTNKPRERKGKIQLINGVNEWTPMRKGMGEKRRELSDDNRNAILHEYAAFKDSDRSRILTADDLGFIDVPVYRQRRLVVEVTDEAIEGLSRHKFWESGYEDVVRAVDGTDYNGLAETLKYEASKAKLKIRVGLIDAIAEAISRDATDEEYETVERSVDRLGRPVLVPGSNMKERIPLTEDINEHMQREVLPFMPDATWNLDKAKVGYEIPFTRIFYKPEPVRSLEEIDADLREVMIQLSDQLKAVEQ